MSKFSFIIRALNEGRYLGDVLASIKRQTYHDYEVVIVDSGSSDDTVSIALQYGAKVVAISTEDWSWGRALNLGILHSSGDIVCVISGHCILSSDSFLEKSKLLLAKFDALYGAQIPIKGLDAFEEYELYQWYPEGEFLDNSQRILNGRGIGVSNACSIFRRELWNSCKFDEKLQSMEDAEWAFRIATLGKAIAYSSSISVFHSHEFDPEYSFRKWYCRQYEGYKFLNKTFGLYRTAKVNRVRFFLSDLYRIFRLPFEAHSMNQLLKPNYIISYRSLLGYLIIRNMAIHQAYFDLCSGRKISYWDELKKKSSWDRYIKVTFEVK